MPAVRLTSTSEHYLLSGLIRELPSIAARRLNQPLRFEPRPHRVPDRVVGVSAIEPSPGVSGYSHYELQFIRGERTLYRYLYSPRLLIGQSGKPSRFCFLEFGEVLTDFATRKGLVFSHHAVVFNGCGYNGVEQYALGVD